MATLTKLWMKLRLVLAALALAGGLFFVWLRAHDEKVRRRMLYEQKRKALEKEEEALRKAKETLQSADPKVEADLDRVRKAKETLDREMLETVAEGMTREEIDALDPDDVLRRINEHLARSG